MIRVRERLQWIVPATIVLIFLLLYANTKSTFKAGLVLATVPFSAVGAIWLFHLLGYNVSIAAWVGMIALLGLDAETAVFMLLFLDLSWEDARKRGRKVNGSMRAKSMRSAGSSVTASTAASSIARFFDQASGRKRRPSWSTRAKIGRKATAMTRREKKTDGPTSLSASRRTSWKSPLRPPTSQRCSRL